MSPASTRPVREALGADSVRFDLFPTADRQCLLSVLVPGEFSPAESWVVPPCSGPTICVFRYDFHGEISADPGNHEHWVGIWTLVAKIPSKFVEPFYMFPVGDRYQFISQSGKLYRTDDDNSRLEREMLTHPLSESAAIRALLQDADGQKFYAFTEDSFFEIAERIKFHPFDLGPLENVKPEDPLPTVRRCALALRAVVPAAKQADDGRKP